MKNIIGLSLAMAGAKLIQAGTSILSATAKKQFTDGLSIGLGASVTVCAAKDLQQIYGVTPQAENDFQHFLSYTGNSYRPDSEIELMREAYYAAWEPRAEHHIHADEFCQCSALEPSVRRVDVPSEETCLVCGKTLR